MPSGKGSWVMSLCNSLRFVQSWSRNFNKLTHKWTVGKSRDTIYIQTLIYLFQHTMNQQERTLEHKTLWCGKFPLPDRSNLWRRMKARDEESCLEVCHWIFWLILKFPKLRWTKLAFSEPRNPSASFYRDSRYFRFRMNFIDWLSFNEFWKVWSLSTL